MYMSDAIQLEKVVLKKCILHCTLGYISNLILYKYYDLKNVQNGVLMNWKLHDYNQ